MAKERERIPAKTREQVLNVFNHQVRDEVYRLVMVELIPYQSWQVSE